MELHQEFEKEPNLDYYYNEEEEEEVEGGEEEENEEEGGENNNKKKKKEEDIDNKDNKLNEVYDFIKNKILSAPTKYDFIIKDRNKISNAELGMIGSLIYFGLILLLKYSSFK